MGMFHVLALLVCLTALFSYLNHRYLHLHPSIGVMLIAMLTSLAVTAGADFAGPAGAHLRAAAAEFLGRVRFGDALLQWMLGFLLFAGALGVDLSELARQRWLTVLLATVGTVISTAVVAVLIYPLLKLAGSPLPMGACLLFGALISPTDPVAVLSFIRHARAPRSIETIIAAESLFNDGVGVVLFLTLRAYLTSGNVQWTSGIELLARESLGGVALGLVAGWLVYSLLRRARHYELEVLLTLALVMGTYSVAEMLSVSGPIAVTVAGLVTSYHRRTPATARARHDLHEFWQLADELLNAVLFVLIGLQVLVMRYTPHYALAAAGAIVVVLLARYVSVQALVLPLRAGSSSYRRSAPGLVRILTWGGLRGGLPIAMALAVPDAVGRDPIVAITYGVVAFSILVQGTTLRRLVARWTPRDPAIASGMAS